MNLNRKQFLTVVERVKALLEELQADYSELKLKPVFSCFGPRSGQCDLTTDIKKITMEFPDVLAGDARWALRDLMFKIRSVEKGGDQARASNLWKEADRVEQSLLDPDLKLYCGDTLIEGGVRSSAGSVRLNRYFAGKLFIAALSGGLKNEMEFPVSGKS